jgi:BirA family transcriptional regulator, biotin operon repressor / biotin---[acetyl-CoA-carboxylase] ligase
LLPINAKTIIGASFLELYEVDSTNIYAIDKVQANLAAHGTVFFTHHQTNGKGQRGKKWMAEPSSNILMSVVIDSSFLLISQQFALSIMSSLACIGFFKAHAGVETSIKWPNDLFWRDRKAGGILIENHLQGNKCQYSVIGIGININQTAFDPNLQQAVSLKQITGKVYKPVELAKSLCAELEHRFQELVNGGMEQQLEEYNTYLYKKDCRVSMKKGAVVFHPIIKGVSAMGKLLVEEGLNDEFDFGEVAWIIS